MTTYEAPAKVNLSLHVSPPTDDGRHPLDSVVQTIEWCDLLDVEVAEEPPDSIDVEGLELETEDNLVVVALRAARSHFTVPPVNVVVHKEIPIGAGLGGGSSDAAATLLAASEVSGFAADLVRVAAGVGGDVPLFLVGGTVRMTGFGEGIESLPRLAGFAVAVAKPHFALSTTEVYGNWDRLEGPEGETVPDGLLPPVLRGGMPMRNDLLPAAIDLRPELGDFMADLRATWGSAVCLTGSGSACFGYFATVDEASDAARSVNGISEIARAVALRTRGVSSLVDEEQV